MNEVEAKEKEIENMIYEIRGQHVMIDRDLAKLYHTETRVLIQKVKRNIERFPKEFCFQMDNGEFLLWKSHFVISNSDKMGLRRPPYVFTEQGVAMLSAIIKTDVAIDVSIKIINTFVLLKRYVGSSLIEQRYINSQVMKNTENIELLQKSFNKLEEKRKTNEIYFNGQIYDAYSKIYEIFNEATKTLIIVDNYADNTLLDIIKRLNVKVVIITKQKCLLTKQDIEKYNAQYDNLSVVYDETFHDRYFILDEKEVYHCGASINRIGYKTFSITLLSDDEVCKSLIEKIESIYL